MLFMLSSSAAELCCSTLMLSCIYVVVIVILGAKDPDPADGANPAHPGMLVFTRENDHSWPLWLPPTTTAGAMQGQCRG